MNALREPPAALTRAQQFLFVLSAAAIAATRFPALSLTLHDWDETQFARGVQEYDVKLHHPHPPGYPLFIAAAKFARLFADSDFHATRAVAAFASMLVFPAAFFLARELRFGTAFAFASAAMTAFVPSIWYYGGTGLSDVPALALVLTASALLLRGARCMSAYVAGVAVTVLTCAIRPHLLLVAAVPALIGAVAQRRRLAGVAAAWAGAAVLGLGIYGGAAYFSSDFPHGYLEQLRHIQKHVAQTDSYRNPYREPLRSLAPRALLFPTGGGRMRFAVVAFAGVAILEAIVRRRRNVAIVVAMFLPLAVFTWLMLDVSAFSRYAVAYLPLHAFLAVAGVEAVAQAVPARARVPLFVVLSGFMTWGLIRWTWPALRFARTEPSPAVAVFDWIRTHVPHVGPRVYVQNNLLYHAYYLLPDREIQLVFHETKLRDEDFAAGNLYVFEGEPQPEVSEARMFRRKRLQLFEITRPRYFEVGIAPMNRIVRWGEGWHLWEHAGDRRWRWMQQEAGILFPPVSDRGELQLDLYAPADATPRPPVITVTWNGKVIDRRTSPPDGQLELRYVLPGRGTEANELRLSTDQVVRPPGDSRELGLMLERFSWTEPSPSRAGGAVERAASGSRDLGSGTSAVVD